MSSCYAKWIRDEDYPWAPTRQEHEAAFIAYEKNWGTPIGFKTVAPSVANDETCRNWWARNLRLGASPGAGIALYRMNIEIDIRAVLPTIRVPTLILHREGDRLINVGNSRYMASRIPNAKYVELDGVDHLPWFGDSDAVLDLIEEFLTGVRPVEGKDRILCTVLFIDIVESTERALTMGDSRWRDLLRTFQQDVQLELDRFVTRTKAASGRLAELRAGWRQSWTKTVLRSCFLRALGSQEKHCRGRASFVDATSHSYNAPWHSAPRSIALNFPSRTWTAACSTSTR